MGMLSNEFQDTLLLLVIPLLLSTSNASPTINATILQLTKDMSAILNRLLDGYDKKLRPDIGNKPLTVHMDISLRSMGPISEREMIYSMDCYLRQEWQDTRLAFSAPLDKVSIGIKMLEKIWHPDTIFYNGKNSYLHTITTPNKFIRIDKNGTILYSQRLTIRASCPMKLESFPMDTQRCPLHIGSFGYSSTDVLYRWRHGLARSVEMAQNMTLSQFELVAYPAESSMGLIKGNLHSLLTVTFHLRRRTGYFLIQIYVPCSLLTVLSWVSFWINREATSDRIGLGIMTVLTMTFLGMENRTDLPRVSYTTALDLFVAVCFVFLFAAIVQFAAVHYFTKYGSGEHMLLRRKSSDTEDSEDEPAKRETDRFTSDTRTAVQQPSVEADKRNGDTAESYGYHTFVAGEENSRRKSRCKTILTTIMGSIKRNEGEGKIRKVKDRQRINSVSVIDKVSRVLFPLAFLMFNIVYWISYSR